MRTVSVRLIRRPVGEPVAADFDVGEVEVPAPGPGQVLLDVLWLSLDPYMRGQMGAGPSTAPIIEIGAPMTGEVIARVSVTRDDRLTTGDIVRAPGLWQARLVCDVGNAQRIDAQGLPLSAFLGVLGMPGRTAYFGLVDVGRPKPAETLVVAAAAGPVGSLVGQIGKRMGCRVVGIAGSQAKCDWLTAGLGFDVALSHHAPDFEDELRAACGDGIDIYFENVGGKVLRAVVPLLNRHARVPVCGQAAHYNSVAADGGPDRVPDLMRTITRKRLTLQGFNVDDFDARADEFLRTVGGWVRRGEISFREDIADGVARAPAHFAAMLRGDTFGKALIRVSDGTTG